MPGADAASVRDQERHAVFRGHEGNYFIEDVALILAMALNAGGRRNAPAVEAFGIDSVDAEEANEAVFDGALEGVNESPVFIVEEAAFAGGEDEHFGSGVAEAQEFHVAAPRDAEPFVILTLHLHQD